MVDQAEPITKSIPDAKDFKGNLDDKNVEDKVPETGSREEELFKIIKNATLVEGSTERLSDDEIKKLIAEMRAGTLSSNDHKRTEETRHGNIFKSGPLFALILFLVAANFTIAKYYAAFLVATDPSVKELYEKAQPEVRDYIRKKIKVLKKNRIIPVEVPPERSRFFVFCERSLKWMVGSITN